MAKTTLDTESLRFAVIGGGISGLTAAYRLTRLVPDARVEVFEGSNSLGGVLSTHRQGNLLVEHGADSFLAKQPWAVDLCRELGLAEELIPTNTQHRRALVLRHGKLHPVPEGFVMLRPQRVWPLLRTPLLSWRGKLRMMCERWKPRPVGIDRGDYDVSLAQFATERLGREAFERLVEPLLAGIYTADAERLSIAATMPEILPLLRQHGTLWHRETSQESESQGHADLLASGARYGSFVTLRDGVSRLIEALSAKLREENISRNRPVQSIEREGSDKWRLKFSDHSTSGPYTGVIAALPTPRTAELVETLDPRLGQLLREIEYASSAIVCLLYERDQITRPLDGFGFIVPAIEKRPIVAASFSSVKFPGRVPSGQVLIRVFLGGATQPQAMELSDQELDRIAQAELAEILGVKSAALASEVVRWTEKMPQYHVGHLQKVDAIEDRVNAISGLELAGNGYRGVGIPFCVRSGNLAAERIVARVNSGF